VAAACVEQSGKPTVGELSDSGEGQKIGGLQARDKSSIDLSEYQCANDAVMLLPHCR
jgi:hypothetical protein